MGVRGSDAQSISSVVFRLRYPLYVSFDHFEDEMFLRRRGFVTHIFLIGGTTRVILRSRRCTRGFLNYFSAIIEIFKVVFKGEIVKFSKNCDTFAIKESGRVKVQIMGKKIRKFQKW